MITLIGAEEARIFLAAVPPSLRNNLRREFRQAAVPLTSTIKANASWSTRIPKAVKVKTGFGPLSAGVYVYVDAKIAPHARPLELGSQGNRNFNRHPVPIFAGKGKPSPGPGTYVNQPLRPFFFPAVRAHRPVVINAAQRAIADTLRAH